MTDREKEWQAAIYEREFEKQKQEYDELVREIKQLEREYTYKRGYEDGKRDAVRHGYWIGEFSKERLSIDEDGRVETGFECAICSECGEDLLASEEYFVRGRYCPACGAKMDGKENGE